MMENMVFNTFWNGPELPPLHWTCLESFVRHGHQLRLFGFQKLDLPKGVLFEDARKVISEEQLFQFEGSFSAFSNIFRYKLLLERGGWWVDTDVFCLADAIPECDYAWAREDVDNINGAILRFPAHDPALEAILRDAVDIGNNITVWGQLGPHLLTKHLADRTFSDHFGSTQLFYPLHWMETHLFWMRNSADLVAARCAGAPFLHLWASMFRDYGIDMYGNVPQGSFLERIYREASGLGDRPPIEPDAERQTMQNIRNFLSLDWVNKTSVRLFGYEMWSKLDCQDSSEYPKEIERSTGHRVSSGMMHRRPPKHE